MGRKICRNDQFLNGVDRAARQPIQSPQKTGKDDLFTDDRAVTMIKGAFIALP